MLVEPGEGAVELGLRVELQALDAPPGVEQPDRHTEHGQRQPVGLGPDAVHGRRHPAGSGDPVEPGGHEHPARAVADGGVAVHLDPVVSLDPAEPQLTVVDHGESGAGHRFDRGCVAVAVGAQEVEAGGEHR